MNVKILRDYSILIDDGKETQGPALVVVVTIELAK